MEHNQSKRNCRIKLGFAVIIVLVGLLVAACGNSEEIPLAVPVGAQAGELTRLESCIYRTGDSEYAAECSTLSVPENRQDPNRDYVAELDPPDAILGAPFSLLMWSMGQGWSPQPIAEEYHQVQRSDVETLLESGSLDFMNPPQDGTEKLLPYLSNGQRVILKEFGHGNSFWNSQPEARIHLLTTYYNTGESDDSLYTLQPLNFDVGRGWPGLAKMGFAIISVSVVVLLALVILIVVFIRRRLRNRKVDHL